MGGSVGRLSSGEGTYAPAMASVRKSSSVASRLIFPRPQQPSFSSVVAISVALTPGCTSTALIFFAISALHQTLNTPHRRRCSRKAHEHPCKPRHRHEGADEPPRVGQCLCGGVFMPDESMPYRVPKPHSPITSQARNRLQRVVSSGCPTRARSWMMNRSTRAATRGS